MLLGPMLPSPLTASGDTFSVYCSRCGIAVNSADVTCDYHDTAGTYYCGACAIHVDDGSDLYMNGNGVISKYSEK